MGLNIKNEQTYAVVRELAALTGESMTSVIEDAVRRRIAEVEATSAATAHSRAGAVAALLAEIRHDLSEEDREALRRVDREMYDDAGLPR